MKGKGKRSIASKTFKGSAGAKGVKMKTAGNKAKVTGKLKGK